LLLILTAASFLGAWQPWLELDDRAVFELAFRLWRTPLLCVALVYLVALLGLLTRGKRGPWLARGVGLAGLSSSALATTQSEVDLVVIGFSCLNGLLVVVLPDECGPHDWRLTFATAALPPLLVWALAPRAPGLGSCILIGWGPAPAIGWLVPLLVVTEILGIGSRRPWVKRALPGALLGSLTAMALTLSLRLEASLALPDGLLVFWLLGQPGSSAVTSQAFADVLGGNPWGGDWLVAVGLAFLLAALVARKIRPAPAPAPP
jgi:hypothetical protein